MRSSSGDIDIPIILLGMEPISNVEVYCVQRQRFWSENRRLLRLNSCSLTDQEKKALVRAACISRKWLCGTFFTQREALVLETSASKDPAFLDICSRLGTEMHVSDEMFSAIETYVWFLYGEKKIEKVNARYCYFFFFGKQNLGSWILRKKWSWRLIFLESLVLTKQCLKMGLNCARSRDIS